MAAKRKRGTRQSTFNKRRKGALAVVIPWMQRFGFALVVCITLLWASSWLYLSGALSRAGDWSENKMLLATADMGFAIDNILVEGRNYTDPAVLLAIVNIKKGDPLFSFNPVEAQNLIAQIGWVENVRVERRWPDTIYIGLSERTPLALWQSDKRVKLLDNHGEVIVTDKLQRFADLVMVVGDGAPQASVDLIGTLKAEPLVFDRIESAKYIGQRRWDLYTKTGIEISLPEADMGLALRRLAQAQQDDALLDRDLRGIDVRESDRITVRTKPGSVSEYQSSLKVNAAGTKSTGNNI